MERSSNYLATFNLVDSQFSAEDALVYEGFLKVIKILNKNKTVINRNGHKFYYTWYLVKRPRLGKNNVNTEKYKNKRNGYQMIKMADGTRCDVYMYQRVEYC